MNINKNTLVLVVCASLVLIGAFLFLKPKTISETPPSSETSTNNEASSTPGARLNTKTFDLVVSANKLIAGPETLKVTEGEDVIIKITSDTDEEFHLHGYDKSVELTKDTPAELVFTANISGRFVYELEKSKTDIGALEVSPK